MSISPTDEKSRYDHFENSSDKDVTHVVSTQKDSRLAEVLLKEKPNLRSLTTFKLFAVLFVSYLCNAQNGFDSSTFGGISDLPNFQAQFGTNIASNVGFLAAIYIIGG